MKKINKSKDIFLSLRSKTPPSCLSKSDYVNRFRFLCTDAYLSMAAQQKFVHIKRKAKRGEEKFALVHRSHIIVIEFKAIDRPIIIFTEHYHTFNKNGLCSVSLHCIGSGSVERAVFSMGSLSFGLAFEYRSLILSLAILDLNSLRSYSLLFTFSS